MKTREYGTPEEEENLEQEEETTMAPENVWRGMGGGK